MKVKLFVIAALFFCSRLFAQSDKTQILLVGTVHEFQDSFKSLQNFPTVIQGLSDFAPDMICIESIPTWDTASLKAVRTKNMEYAQKLRLEKELEDSDLELLITKYLDIIKLNPTDLLARSNLANTLYANHDFYNAYYHWYFMQNELRIHPELRTKDLEDSFTQDSIHLRVYKSQSNSEFGHIVFPLANAESIFYLENIDDRADDEAFQKLSKAVPRRLLLNLRIFKFLKFYKSLVAETSASERAGQLLQKVNDPGFQKTLVTQIDGFTKKWANSKKSRQILELWYTRNIRMADRVSAAVNRSNSKRVIVFVGAAHLEYMARVLKLDNRYEVILYSQYSK